MHKEQQDYYRRVREIHCEEEFSTYLLESRISVSKL